MASNPKPWHGVEIPATVAGVPAMLSDEERRYLIWSTAVAHEGWGAVVDLGPWLGGSSVALAEGLRRSGRPGVVHSRDLFAWARHYMPAHVDVDLPEGADFQHLFDEHTRAYRDRIDARRTDLLAAEWDEGPIEILFVDAAKSWELLNSILRVFAPHLEPGRSRVVLQDFCHFPTYFVSLAFDGRPGWWEEVEEVEHGSTVTFRPRRAWDAAELPYHDGAFAFDAARRSYERRIAASDPARARIYHLCLLVAAAVRGETAVADQQRAALRAAGSSPQLESEITAADARGRQGIVDGIHLAVDRGDLAGAQEFLRRGESVRAADADRREPAARLQAAAARLHHARAGAALGRRDFDAAHDALAAVLRCAREDRATLRNAFSLLEQILRAEQDGERASRTIAALMPRFAQSADLLVLAAIVAAHRGEAEESRACLARALRIDPDHPDARRLADGA